jgi:Uma2 family endonuclease
MPNAEPHVFRWTREDYYRLCEAEWFLGRRVQLIGGEIIEYPPSSNWHAAAVTLTGDALRLAFGPGYWVRVKGSLALSPCSVPDPALAVVPGTPRDHRTQEIATSALLVVEVSDTTLHYDRTHKASLYAAASIADYWIVNLVQRQLEVYRDPVADATQVFGFRYANRTILDPADAVTPLAAPQARVTVADLFP